MATALAPGFRFSGRASNKLSYGQVKRLAEAFGLPGDAMAQIAEGESSLYADVQQRDPGNGMVGYGLLQMTPNAWGKGSAAMRYFNKLGGIRAMSDPVKNMQMARFLYAHAGNRLSPWYGTSHLTNRSGEGTLRPVNRAAIPKGLGTLPGGFEGATASSFTTPKHLAFDPAAAQPSDQTTLPARPQLQITAPTLPAFAAQPVTSQTPTSNPTPVVLPNTTATPPPRFDAGQALEALTTLQQAQGADTSTIGGDPVKAPGQGGGGGGGGGRFTGGTGSKVLELIHSDGSGQPGFGIKNGQVVNGAQVFSSVWGGHENHVHVAAGPKTVLALGRLAQSLGLHVGENPHFGGVSPVHVPGSYHYKGEAIDVSGSAGLMDRFARLVERYNRTRRLPQ